MNWLKRVICFFRGHDMWLDKSTVFSSLFGCPLKLQCRRCGHKLDIKD